MVIRNRKQILFRTFMFKEKKLREKPQYNHHFPQGLDDVEPDAFLCGKYNRRKYVLNAAIL